MVGAWGLNLFIDHHMWTSLLWPEIIILLLKREPYRERRVWLGFPVWCMCLNYELFLLFGRFQMVCSSKEWSTLLIFRIGNLTTKFTWTTFIEWLTNVSFRISEEDIWHRKWTRTLFGRIKKYFKKLKNVTSQLFKGSKRINFYL